jgi:hypothetical protein
MKSELREEARLLRREGKSVKEIQKILGVSKGSVSLWVRDIELTEAQKLTLQEKQHRHPGQMKGAETNRQNGIIRRTAYQDAGRMKAREMSPLHMAGCMLYWAEGAKSKRNCLVFVNSDSNMMIFFMKFLRKELGVADSLITVKIHCHTNVPEEVKKIEEYWLATLSLPTTCLRKTMYKKGNNALTHRKLLYGVCGIWITRSEIVQHILGAIQEYGGFDNPDWLF